MIYAWVYDTTTTVAGTSSFLLFSFLEARWFTQVGPGLSEEQRNQRLSALSQKPLGGGRSRGKEGQNQAAWAYGETQFLTSLIGGWGGDD